MAMTRKEMRERSARDLEAEIQARYGRKPNPGERLRNWLTRDMVEGFTYGMKGTESALPTELDLLLQESSRDLQPTTQQQEDYAYTQQTQDPLDVLMMDWIQSKLPEREGEIMRRQAEVQAMMPKEEPEVRRAVPVVEPSTANPITRSQAQINDRYAALDALGNPTGYQLAKLEAQGRIPRFTAPSDQTLRMAGDGGNPYGALGPKPSSAGDYYIPELGAEGLARIEAKYGAHDRTPEEAQALKAEQARLIAYEQGRQKLGFSTPTVRNSSSTGTTVMGNASSGGDVLRLLAEDPSLRQVATVAPSSIPTPAAPATQATAPIDATANPIATAAQPAGQPEAGKAIARAGGPQPGDVGYVAPTQPQQPFQSNNSSMGDALLALSAMKPGQIAAAATARKAMPHRGTNGAYLNPLTGMPFVASPLDLPGIQGQKMNARGASDPRTNATLDALAGLGTAIVR